MIDSNLSARTARRADEMRVEVQVGVPRRSANKRTGSRMACHVRREEHRSFRLFTFVCFNFAGRPRRFAATACSCIMISELYCLLNVERRPAWLPFAPPVVPPVRRIDNLTAGSHSLYKIINENCNISRIA